MCAEYEAMAAQMAVKLCNIEEADQLDKAINEHQEEITGTQEHQEDEDEEVEEEHLNQPNEEDEYVYKMMTDGIPSMEELDAERLTPIIDASQLPPIFTPRMVVATAVPILQYHMNMKLKSLSQQHWL